MSSNLAGTLLIARPSLHNSFFGRSVILLLQHGEEGAFGLVLNKPAPTKEVPFPVFVGGPCKLQGLLMLHGQEEWVEEPKRTRAKGKCCPAFSWATRPASTGSRS